jgi:hypothetical protein
VPYVTPNAVLKWNVFGDLGWHFMPLVGFSNSGVHPLSGLSLYDSVIGGVVMTTQRCLYFNGRHRDDCWCCLIPAFIPRPNCAVPGMWVRDAVGTQVYIRFCIFLAPHRGEVGQSLLNLETVI